MNVVLWPFCSQQNKESGRFLIDTCAACKQCRFLMDMIRSELNWNCKIVLPDECESNHLFLAAEILKVATPTNNVEQRVHWDTSRIYEVLADADLFIANHETIAVPAKQLLRGTNCKIVTMCSITPITQVEHHLFAAAFASSDLVVAPGEHTAEKIRRCSADVSVWPLAFDENTKWSPTNKYRPIDVFFIRRASASNYTHHVEFLEAVKDTELKVLYADTTGYMKQQDLKLQYSSPDKYIEHLHASKIAVSFDDGDHCGYGIREAIAAGCVPVVLKNGGGMELVGANSPHAVAAANPENIRMVLQAAVKFAGTRVTYNSIAYRNAMADSYQASWPTVKEDLLSLTQ